MMDGDTNLVAPIFGALGVIITALSGYWAAKRNAKKDITVNDRQLLSQDEREFRATILKENKELREKIDLLSGQVSKLKIENGKLRVRIVELEAKQCDAEDVKNQEDSQKDGGASPS